jgi:hypothetical protein
MPTEENSEIKRNGECLSGKKTGHFGRIRTAGKNRLREKK